jgi:magnesium transporter
MKEISQSFHPTENIQELLDQIQSLLEKIAFAKNLKETVDSPPKGQTDTQEFPQHKQLLIELTNKVNLIHVADIAFILAALPIKLRKLFWDNIGADRHGKVLLELSDAVRETLITSLSHEELLACTKRLNTNEVADLALYLPQSVMRNVFKSLSIEKREQLRSAMAYPHDTVGSLMDFDMVTIRKESTVEAVLRLLRRMNNLPPHTDQLFVVNRDNLFEGVLPLNILLVNEAEATVANLMSCDYPIFHPEDKTQEFSQAFGRYALVSVPVIDDDGKLLGRIPLNTLVNFVHAKAENEKLTLVGLHEQEDIFASVWKSAKNRWIWLSLNLCTAFLASRVIGSFEDTIEEFVALATLMPIVASLARNSANQTMIVIIRSMTLGQLNVSSTHRLLFKELAISLLNGLVWGGIAGGFVYLLYKNLPLALVLSGAMLLNQLLGALIGLCIPLTLQKFGRNPVSAGSNILLTAISTSGGFFIFLGLATIFLIK